jgi:hypothetical protein
VRGASSRPPARSPTTERRRDPRTLGRVRRDDSGDLTTTPRSALAPRTPGVVLRLDDEGVATAVRALFDGDELDLEPTARALSTASPAMAAARNLLPVLSALRAGCASEVWPQHNVARSTKARGFDLQALALDGSLFGFEPDEFLFLKESALPLTQQRLFQRGVSASGAAVRAVHRLLQKPDLFVALDTSPHGMLPPFVLGEFDQSGASVKRVRSGRSVPFEAKSRRSASEDPIKPLERRDESVAQISYSAGGRGPRLTPRRLRASGPRTREALPRALPSRSARRPPGFRTRGRRVPRREDARFP